MYNFRLQNWYITRKGRVRLWIRQNEKQWGIGSKVKDAVKEAVLHNSFIFHIYILELIVLFLIKKLFWEVAWWRLCVNNRAINFDIHVNGLFFCRVSFAYGDGSTLYEMVYFSYIKSYDGESTGGTFDCNDTDRIALHERVIFFYCPDKVEQQQKRGKEIMKYGK